MTTVDLAQPPPIDTGRPELDDLLETFHYQLVVAQEPAAAMVGVAHLLAAVPDWLDELVTADPNLQSARRCMLAGWVGEAVREPAT